ncbi:myb/sant-like dna-binding domain [Holotrichia oblita]|uniref:Myb/sant-like dna-binding domain n=1 Tax=Holotrichia oblita TaxID=644536 RepID=A0ACB9TN74_HOLOL|nr:myb/sant-like dna-binding domain [Holotrichia oblita]
MEKKEEVWQAIEKEFNSHSLVFRSADVLKRFYNNNKKEMRKLAANTKANMQATGGGPSSSSQSSNPVYDLTLDIINKKTVFGLINKYDDDAEVILQENLLYTIYILNIFQKDSNRIHEDTQEGFIQNFEITNEEDTNNVETIIIEMDSETNSHKADKDTNEYTAQNDWGACTSQMLKTPVNPKLKEKKGQKETWVRRRRPQISKTENVAKKYEEVAEIKKSVLQLQENILKAQQENIKLVESSKQQEQVIKLKREEEEFILRKENLLLDIKIKQEQLKALYSANNK